MFKILHAGEVVDVEVTSSVVFVTFTEGEDVLTVTAIGDFVLESVEVESPEEVRFVAWTVTATGFLGVTSV